MRLLLDENVPSDIIKDFRRAGHDVEHVNRKCKGKPDSEVLEYALNNKRVIISFDSDFCGFKKREHYGIIKVNGKLENPLIAILELLRKIKDTDTKNVYYQIDTEIAFKEEKKFARKHRWILKNLQRTRIPLECLNNKNKYFTTKRAKNN